MEDSKLEMFLGHGTVLMLFIVMFGIFYMMSSTRKMIHIFLSNFGIIEMFFTLLFLVAAGFIFYYREVFDELID